MDRDEVEWRVLIFSFSLNRSLVAFLQPGRALHSATVSHKGSLSRSAAIR